MKKLIKVCNKCKISKPITNFYPAPQCKYGVRGTCKKCQCAKSVKTARLRNKENPKRRREVLYKHNTV